MITEDEHDLSAPVVVGREVSTLDVKITEDETTWFQKFLSRFRWIKDKKLIYLFEMSWLIIYGEKYYC